MFKRLAIIQIILLTFQVVLYFGCEKFQHNPHNVERPIDRYIPFIPATAIIYSLWFPLIAVYPIALYYSSPLLYEKYMVIMVVEIILSVLCYLVYPTTFTRPVPPNSLWGKSMKLIYKASYKGLNCAPSLHCSSCFLIIFITLTCPNMSLALSLTFGIIAFLVVVSTLTTKQHTVIDLVSALFLFIVCLILYKFIPEGWFIPVMNFIKG
ncbi:phosphatase PAP2 family protein [Peptoniphilus catoniae]|uniref:phosphatase PAP2 family protein n=1 Tax=Peptoniphilus catoniae TaxID=1660341 RepID=UPI0010FE31FD|nr:phosphatase PAP2 family protein [Peptoniphilus catoniae]